MDKGQLTGGQKRLAWIDQARGAAMFLVVLGHAHLGKTPQSLIYSFHMPLFFMITGLTLQKDRARSQSFRDYLMKHGKRLVVPYFWCDFCMFPMWFLQHRVLDRIQDEGFFPTLKGIFYSNSLLMASPANPTWFFLTLFLALLGYKVLLNLSGGDGWKEFVLVIACGFLGFADQKKDLPWHLNTAACGIVFLYIGTKIMEAGYRGKTQEIYGWMRKKRTAVRNILYVAGMLVAGTLCWQINGRVSMHGNIYGKSLLLFYATAVLFFLCCISAVHLVPKDFNFNIHWKTYDTFCSLAYFSASAWPAPFPCFRTELEICVLPGCFGDTAPDSDYGTP